jgi:plastocyanin
MLTRFIEVGPRNFDPPAPQVGPGDTVVFRIVDEDGEFHSIETDTDRTWGDIQADPQSIDPWKSPEEKKVTITGTTGEWFYFCGVHPTQHEGSVSLSAKDD